LDQVAAVATEERTREPLELLERRAETRQSLAASDLSHGTEELAALEETSAPREPRQPQLMVQGSRAGRSLARQEGADWRRTLTSTGLLATMGLDTLAVQAVLTLEIA